MKIGFVYGGYENLGMEILSSLLEKDGHQVELFYDGALFADNMLNVDFLSYLFDDRNELLLQMKTFEPDMIGFSVFTDTYRRELAFASKIKKIMDVPVIFGGPHPSLVPDRVLKRPEVDLIAVGEAEKSFPELINRMDAGEVKPDVPGIYWKGEKRSSPYTPISDLNLLPVPDKSLFYDAAPYLSRVYSIMTSRGCLYRCTFCNHDSYRSIYGDAWSGMRRRTPENVIEELQWGRKFQYNEVMFEDDMFVSDQSWSIKFLSLYRRNIGKRFICICHPSMINRDIARALAESGCLTVEIGVQTVNAHTRKYVLNRYESTREIANCISLLNEYDIGCNICHIAGLPGETPDDQRKALEFYSHFNINRVYYVMLTYYPETAIIKHGLEHGEVTPLEIEKTAEGLSSTYEYAGSLIKPLQYQRFRLLFGVLPLIPGRWIRWILRNIRLDRLPKDPLFSKFLPALIGLVVFKREINVKIYLRRYIYHSIKKIIKRARMECPFLADLSSFLKYYKKQ